MKYLAIACLLAISGCIQFAKSEETNGADAGADAAGDTAGDLPVRDYSGDYDIFTSFMPHHYCDDGRGPVECCHSSECPHHVAQFCDHGVCVEYCSPTTECCIGGDSECPEGRLNCNQNKCEAVCKPACDGRECGAAVNCGAADACGTCPPLLECRGGRCKVPLVP